MTDSIMQLAEDVWAGRRNFGSVRDFSTVKVEEVAEGVMMSPGFGHAFAIDHGDGLVLFDTGSRSFAPKLFEGVRNWSPLPVTHAVYSHGHLDHVFGVGPFDDEATEKGWSKPTVVAHENVARRFERYSRTQGYNTRINRRQFRNARMTWPQEYRMPDVTFADRYDLVAGELTLELHHHRGETDDHAVGWIADKRVLFPGDLFLWVSPNAGNPQKVQRYPVEWAAALRWMADLGAKTMLGSHGVPIVGRDRIHEALSNTARYLEEIVDQTMELINAGATLVDTVHTVQVPADLAALPYLQPLYDEPEFIVRNVWRQFAGWYDGNPAHLKPARESELAAELASLCGGADALADRARELALGGDLRLACHLAQFAVDADPTGAHAHQARSDVYAQRASVERSTMSKGIYSWTAAESRAMLSGNDVLDELPGLAGRTTVSL